MQYIRPMTDLVIELLQKNNPIILWIFNNSLIRNKLITKNYSNFWPILNFLWKTHENTDNLRLLNCWPYERCVEKVLCSLTNKSKKKDISSVAILLCYNFLIIIYHQGIYESDKFFSFKFFLKFFFLLIKSSLNLSLNLIISFPCLWQE